MSTDHKYYYNFEEEIKLSSFVTLKSEGNTLKLKTTVNTACGDYVFLAPLDPDLFPTLTLLTVNGKRISVTKRDAFYVEHDYPRFGKEIALLDGENEIIADFYYREGITLENIPLRLIKAEDPPSYTLSESKLHKYPSFDYKSDEEELLTDNFLAGIGKKTAPGRFGFTKGDGLLDCAMPALGVVDKMYLCGQPKYKKPYRWSYSLLPEGMPLHASFEPKDVEAMEDAVSANHLSVRWEAKYGEDSFSCTYSLASPGILTERSDGKMRLSGLRFAGNYSSVLMPMKEGIIECPLDCADVSSMAENWLLLFNSTEFPDVPLMLIFDRRPGRMKVTRDEKGRLSSLDFEGVPLMFSLTPFGIERFDPQSMPIDEAIRRAEFWSRALLAYPVGHMEYFRLDEDKETVTVRQKFDYRIIKDEWGTEPLKTAPLPPPLTLCKTADTGNCFDFMFPTKYGHLYGRLSDWSEYTVPMMPTDRRFPIPDENSKISELLSDGMREFVDFSSKFDADIISYPYTGAHLEAFAFASSMSLYMKDTDRAYLKEKLKERIAISLDKSHNSEYVVLNWGEMMAENPDFNRVIEIYSDESRRRMTIGNFFTRKEPFTNTDFDICYLNVSFISQGKIKTASNEEIRNIKIPLIENDWGIGLTFYYLYLASLATGSFETVRQNWAQIKRVYSYFEYMHDFACMGTGYSDNAITWVEGANYGAFTSFIKMAEAVGDKEARDFGIYNAAKQFALRLAIMRSSVEYFPKYFEVSPWYVAKHFHEELAPKFAFQNYPNVYFEDLRRDGVYNFTTEGLYPEAYTGYRKYGGKVYDTVMEKLRYALANGLENPNFHWGIIQQTTAALIDMANDRNASPEQFKKFLDFALKNNLIVPEWRGIHIFSRALPKNYFLAQILAWEETKSHKAWLISWEQSVIMSAKYSEKVATVSFKYSGTGKMRIVIGVLEEPKEILLNGEKLDYIKTKIDKIELYPQTDGVIELIF